MSYPPIPVHYIAQIERYLAAQGVDTLAWLHRVGLTKQDVVSDEVMLTYDDYETLILDAMAKGNEDIGLQLGSRLSVNSHGALGFAMLNCASIAEVLKLVDRYLTTRTPLLSVSQRSCGESVSLELIELFDIQPIRRCFMEVVVMTFGNILQTLLPDEAVIQRVNFSFEEPDYSPLYQQLGCAVTFGSDKTQIFMDKNLLHRPLIFTDQHSLHQATHLCEQELEKIQSSRSCARQVRIYLMNSREQFLTLPQIAAKMNLTPRTLHRRLERESTSFQQVLEEVRFTLAKQYLALQQHSVKQVAYLLGYTDVANFRRAFKRWQGESPATYRQHLGSH